MSEITEIKHFIVESHFRKELDKYPGRVGMKVGWGNGYVILPKEHPDYGKSYEEINASVHGGLTFADESLNISWPELPDFCRGKEGWWIIGFDTCHLEDDENRWPKERVEREAMKLVFRMTELWIIEKRKTIRQ